MKYIDEFRNRALLDKAAAAINRDLGKSSYRFMEVCGTHTMSIFRFGLRRILPDAVELVSGPGCPVCVTPNAYLDKAIAIAGIRNVVVATFGDMFRVPASCSTLEEEKAKGRDIRMVYSTTDALDMAKANPKKEVVFLGVGFETTVPTVARSIIMAKKSGISNYSVLSGHKTMPGPLKKLAASGARVDGFLLPGHVSAITGTRPYGFLAERYGKRCVVSGFEPLDIMQSVDMLIRQNRPRIEIQYDRIVSPEGNGTACKAISEVFLECPSEWRGMGVIPSSGLKIRPEYSGFDAEKRFSPKVPPPKEHSRCRCGEVLRGSMIPTGCALFAKACTPEHPVGACMVSTEGACAAYYKYRDKTDG